MFCFEPRVFRLLFLPTFYSVTASFSATVAVSIVFPILVSVLLLERSLPEFSFFFLVTMRRFYAFLELMYSLFDSFRSFSLIRLNLCSFARFRSCPLSPCLSGVSVHFLSYNFVVSPNFSDFCDSDVNYYLRMRLYLSSVDPGTSSKSFSCVPVV